MPTRSQGGSCAVGKAIVVGAKDRETNRVSAAVVGNTDAKTLQGFVGKRAANGATVYTDDHGGYQGMLSSTKPSSTASASTSTGWPTPTG